ncbi:MAG: iron chelate uptake ABC transporter family permease subunit [Candidatus Krumholzibacteriia bacterium]
MEQLAGSMIYPFLVCLVLAGIHVYLGIHVITRKVIFVDLALAQIAALGAVYGVLLGYELHEDPWAIRGFSLAFAGAGAAVFSFTRTRHERVPQEAIIGIAYAVSLAATILASAHLPHGADEVREMLSGSILWVRGSTIVYTALLYAAVGVFHYVYRRRFLLISESAEKAEAQGINVRLWDFLFYMSFGVVVTNAVAIAGVLLVFSYLIIPAVVAVLFARRLGPRLIIGWSVGTVVSFFGVVVSYAKDLPSGPTIVVGFAAVLIVAAAFRFVIAFPSRGRQLGKVAAVAAILVVFAFASRLLEKSEGNDPLEMIHSPVKNQRLAVLKMLETDPELWGRAIPVVPHLFDDPEPEVRAGACDLVAARGQRDQLPAVHSLLVDVDDLVRESALECVKALGDRSSTGPLLKAVAVETDEYLKVEMAEELLELGEAKGIPVLIDLMDSSPTPRVRKDAHEHLSAHIPISFRFNASVAAGANDQEVNAVRLWWAGNGGHVRWHPDTKIFASGE